MRSGGVGSSTISLRIGAFILDTIPVFYYLRAMKNITITLPEETARWLRIKAAEDERSVSKWLAELLEGLQRQEDEYEVAMKRALAIKPRKMEWVDGRKPTREELHDRAAFR